MIKPLFIASFLFLLGCGATDKGISGVYFAGEIVNPTNKYVVLYKGDVVIDSAALDDNNRFYFKLDSISEGLHHFNHAPELQYVFLQSGDSVLLRLNTMDFDESLVFTGTGSSVEVNNFLIDLFLASEEEKLEVYKKGYALTPKAFSALIDSLRFEKVNNLNLLEKEYELSESALDIASASIDYTYFQYKEEYPFEHKKHMGKQEVLKLPNGFYDYRKSISFHNSKLNYLRPYYDFMQSYIKNLSFFNCSVNCEIESNLVRNQLHFNKHRLGLIDSLIDEQELKDNLFRNVAINYLLMSHDNERNIANFIEDFHLKSGNNRHIKEINDLFLGIQNIQPQKKVPDIMVTGLDGAKISLQEISKDKKVVFYFWTAANRAHFENMVKRVRQLSKAKENYQFVGINIKTDTATWKGMVETAGLDKQSQYKADDFEEVAKTLVLDKLNKCIIAEDATIVDAFSDMYAVSFNP